MSSSHYISSILLLNMDALGHSALAGGPAAGAILKASNGSYTGMIVLCGVANIAGSAFILWSRLRINPRVLARV